MSAKPAKKTVRVHKFQAGTSTKGWLVQRWGMSDDGSNPNNRDFYQKEEAFAYAEDLNKRKIHREPAYGDEVLLVSDTCTCRRCPHCRKPLCPF